MTTPVVEQSSAADVQISPRADMSSSNPTQRPPSRVKHIVAAVAFAAMVMPTSNTGQPVTVIRQGLDYTSSNGATSTPTVPEAVEPPSLALSVKQLHEMSGLTWEQLSRLFGVSRRAVHNWANGGRMTARHSERLAGIYRRIAELPAGLPTERRDLLLVPASNGRSLFEELRFEFSPDTPPIGGSPLTSAELLNASFTD
ncbi:helix-turn-helix transcriptional regulator [Micromonospora sp. NPDC048986]|uniref:helix-turn-helix domain-containing protein n=1 Tax=Micromonospora sp. NPDC048986 TaxID=3155644 RepID=UPI0033C26059